MDENRAMIVEISEVPEIQVPNYEDLLSRLTEEMEAYRNYQVTEDNIPEAKKVKANLNNLTKQIEDERKRVKKIYETPLKEFEAKAKTLSGMVKEVSDEIKAQLDKFEADRQVRKYAWCVDKWFQLGGETAKLIDYTKVHKPSWVNASTPTAKIEEEMQSALRQITANINMIRAMNLPEGDRILGKYLTTRRETEDIRRKGKGRSSQKDWTKGNIHSDGRTGAEGRDTSRVQSEKGYNLHSI